jgi:hypothetical protein
MQWGSHSTSQLWVTQIRGELNKDLDKMHRSGKVMIYWKWSPLPQPGADLSKKSWRSLLSVRAIIESQSQGWGGLLKGDSLLDWQIWLTGGCSITYFLTVHVPTHNAFCSNYLRCSPSHTWSLGCRPSTPVSQRPSEHRFPTLSTCDSSGTFSSSQRSSFIMIKQLLS